MADKKGLTGAKTLIGEDAAKKAAYKGVWSANSPEELKEIIRSARDQADAEVKRETRGKVSLDEPMYFKKEREESDELKRETRGMKKGGKVSSASKRADGIAQRGKTRGRIV